LKTCLNANNCQVVYARALELLLHAFNGPLSGTTQVSQYQKGKTSLDLLEQEIVSGSGISWAICKYAPHPRQITTSASHHSVFRGLVVVHIKICPCHLYGNSLNSAKALNALHQIKHTLAICIITFKSFNTVTVLYYCCQLQQKDGNFLAHLSIIDVSHNSRQLITLRKDIILEKMQTDKPQYTFLTLLESILFYTQHKYMHLGI